MGQPITATATPLLIGIGNTLRSDDGAGIAVSDAMARQAPQLNVRLCPQLSPELAAEISQASAVLFIDAVVIDAAVGAPSGTPQPILQALPGQGAGRPPTVDPFSHALTPEHLLALTLALFNHCPPAWQLLIPGQQWEVGNELSPSTGQACQQALALAQEWLAAHA